ncbi:MAG: hypothetical protein ACE5JL_17430 [Dehalococcoidia bacterium]
MKRVPRIRRPTLRQSESAAVVSLVPVRCAFCRGKGKDPFGVMSDLSTCCVCGGKGTVACVEPYVACRACSGTGVEPFTRLTCLGCKGKGVMAVAHPSETCPLCKGAGLRTSHLYCLRCHGAGVISLVPAGTTVEGSGKEG